MYGSSEKLDELVADVPSIVLAKHSYKCTGVADSVPVMSPGSNFVYHIRVESEDNPEVSIFIFKGSEDEVLEKIRPLRGS